MSGIFGGLTKEEKEESLNEEVFTKQLNQVSNSVDKLFSGIKWTKNWLEKVANSERVIHGVIGAIEHLIQSVNKLLKQLEELKIDAQEKLKSLRNK